MRPIGWFALLTGVAIAALWVVLLATGQVPEVAQGRRDIWFHIVAELGAASLLVTAGIAVLRRTPRAPLVAAAALGALAYTIVNSAGYYAEAGDGAAVGLFAALGAVTAAAAIGLARRSSPGPERRP